MAIISGTTVNWTLSPRVVTIPTSDTSITVDDLQDTLQDLEDGEEGIVWPFLRNMSGGEDLGSGVSVGFTMELQDAQIAFAPRTVSKSSGTVTTANAAGTTLIDSAATFITDGVAIGATIINFTDQSATSVISIDSETQITHYALADGTDNDWDLADVYKIWNETQCEVTGGNVVAVDSGSSPISSINPTFGTQVLKVSSSSATATSQASLEYATFNGGIYWDSVDGKTSITDTVTDGNEANPLKNLSDVLTQAVLKSFIKIYVVGDVTIGATDNVDGYILVGDGPPLSEFTFVSGSSTVKTVVTGCHILGDIGGAADISDCHVEGLTDVGGTLIGTNFNRCILEADSGDAMSLSASSTEHIHMVGCSAGSKSSNPTSIDCNGSAAFMTISYWSGGIVFKNMTNAAQEITINSTGGHVTIDSSCTAGTIIIQGDTKVTNNSSLTPIDETTANLTWLHADGVFLGKMIKGFKEVKKILTSWYLIVYDEGEISGGSEILRKKLTDTSGNDITDLAAGKLAVELENTV